MWDLKKNQEILFGAGMQLRCEARSPTVFYQRRYFYWNRYYGTGGSALLYLPLPPNLFIDQDTARAILRPLASLATLLLGLKSYLQVQTDFQKDSSDVLVSYQFSPGPDENFSPQPFTIQFFDHAPHRIALADKTVQKVWGFPRDQTVLLSFLANIYGTDPQIDNKPDRYYFEPLDPARQDAESAAHDAFTLSPDAAAAPTQISDSDILGLQKAGAGDKSTLEVPPV